jgi:RNA polymerase sigma-70 factor (ECF subfamily)
MSDVAVTEAFEAERSRLTGLAYRMLGTLSDAEDVVQQAWLRWSATEASEIENPAAWLTTVVSRLAIDRLRQQQRRREDYVGPWLPEPLATPAATASPGAAPDPAHAAELADSVTFGFLVLLDRLSPVERAVFVLSEVFGEPHTEIAEVIGKTPAATRQIASRARRRIREQRGERRPADERLLAELVGALAEGSVDRVLSLMSPEVVLTSDGGASRRAARRPVVGADRVARFILNLAGRTPADAQISMESVNGAAALVIRSEELSLVLNADTSADGDHLDAIRLVLNPDKLGGLDHPVEVT